MFIVKKWESIMQISVHKLFTIFIIIILIAGSCSVVEKVDPDLERQKIEQVVNDGIGWALTKDLDLLYSRMAQDEHFLIVNPDSSEIVGFEAFQTTAQSFWMDPRFKAISFEVKNLRITLSESGTVAWYACWMDDIAEWDGRPASWINIRWTGVVEKRQGKWVHTQMHFSFPQEG